MNSKTQTRLRRAKRSRSQIKKLGTTRLTVHRTPRHIYAQVIGFDGRVLCAVSTLDEKVRSLVKHGGNKKAAAIVGKEVAKRALEAGIKRVAYDRSGFKYHGRVQALADAAREAGMEF